LSEYTGEQEDQEPQKEVTRDELVDQLQAQVNYYDQLPQHEKFTFVTNADLAYFMLLVLNILKKGTK